MGTRPSAGFPLWRRPNALLFTRAKVQAAEEAGQLCTYECVRVRVRERANPSPPPPFARARRRHEYLMRRSVFMRLEDGAELREAERDGGGGGKWDGGRFKSHDNGAGLPPWPSSCKSLNVIMTTKGEPARLPTCWWRRRRRLSKEVSSSQQESAWVPYGKINNCHNCNLVREQPGRIKQQVGKSRNSPRLRKPVWAVRWFVKQ